MKENNEGDEGFMWDGSEGEKERKRKRKRKRKRNRNRKRERERARGLARIITHCGGKEDK